MPMHDPHFKQLLRVFFGNLLRPLPELGKIPKPRAIEFLDRNCFGSSGQEVRVVDLVAKVHFQDQAGVVLVHVEHQAKRDFSIRQSFSLIG